MQLDAIHQAKIERGQPTFHLERHTGRNGGRLIKTPVIAALRGNLLHGAATRQQGTALWLGKRAPVLADRDDGSWRQSAPVVLFDGHHRQDTTMTPPGLGQVGMDPRILMGMTGLGRHGHPNRHRSPQNSPRERLGKLPWPA